MKKLSLMIAAFALAGVACGDSDKKSETDAGSDAGDITIPVPEAGGNGPFEDCNEEEALDVLGPAGSSWGDKPKPFTESEAMACTTTTCPDASLMCINDMCGPDGMAFVSCYIGELSACAGDAERAPCREEFTTFACCVAAEKCADGTQADFDACIGAGGACESYIDAFFMCAGQNRACGTTAGDNCIAPDPADAGADKDAGTNDADGSTPKSRASVSTSRVQRIQRALSMRIMSGR